MIRLDGRSRANARARANALANALTLVRDLARDLANACDLDNDEVLVGTLARVNALAGALTNASALNRDHTLDLTRALNHSRDLASTLSEASAIASTIDLEDAGDLNRVFAHATLLRAHSHALALVRDLVDLDPAAHWARAVVAGGARSMPGRMSRGLAELAVRLLPASQRSRYRGEFRSDLVDLPRGERWGYALRVLAGTWELRRALVEAVCTPDGAPARRAER